MIFSRFKFADPGPLVDGELSLVPPSLRYIDEFLHAEWVSGATEVEALRQRTETFIAACPHGQQRADRQTGRVPAYHFWMRIDPRHPNLAAAPLDMHIVGGIGLRIGTNGELELYSGHIGYHVYPAARGRHYAERAARLLLPLAKRHGVSPLWITTNPDNFASRRTCERLGATLVDVVDIPANHPFRQRGETQKCRYRLDL